MLHIFVDLDVSGLDFKDAESPAAAAWKDLIASLTRYGEQGTACGHDRSSPGSLLLVVRSGMLSYRFKAFTGRSPLTFIQMIFHFPRTTSAQRSRH